MRCQWRTGTNGLDAVGDRRQNSFCWLLLLLLLLEKEKGEEEDSESICGGCRSRCWPGDGKGE
jgi:hypothetical protein